MNERDRPILILELDSEDDDGFAGRVSAESGATVPFAGWLGLASAIEAALRAHREEDDPERTGGHGDD